MPRLPGRRTRTRPVDPTDVATTTSWRAVDRPATTTSWRGTDRAGNLLIATQQSDVDAPQPPSGVTLSPAPAADPSRQAIRVRLPRRPRAMERRAMFMAGALLLGVFASAAVARSISDVFVARDQVAAARALNADIRAELDASRAETSFAATPTYLRFAARGLGYGSGKERAFALRAGAPPAPSIVPLGGDLDRAPAEDVLGGIVGSLLEP